MKCSLGMRRAYGRSAALIVLMAMLLVAGIASYLLVTRAPSLISSSTLLSTFSSNSPTETLIRGHYVMVTIPNGVWRSNNSIGMGFYPRNLTVVLGVNSTVVWVNNDTAIHTVTSWGSGPAVLSSGNISPNYTKQNTYAHTFTSPGVYQYHCVIHPWMQGSVTVLASNTTDTSVP